MKTIDELISKTARFLWVPVGYFGLIEIINAAKVKPDDNGFIGAVILFLLGCLNVVNAYGLIRKTKWAFRTTFLAAIANLIFFFLYLLLTMVLLNLYIAYTAFRFRGQIGAEKSDPIISKRWFFRKQK